MPEKGIEFPGTGATDNGEPSHGCWGLKPGPLEEQPVFYTLSYLSSPNLKEEICTII